MRRLGLLLAALAASVCITGTARAEWITSWTAAPLPPRAAMGPFPPTPAFENRTFRQILRLSAGGSAIRVRFTNAYGAKALAMGGARVALLDAAGNEVAGSSHFLTFGGSPTAIMAKGAPLVSDPVKLAVPAFARLAVSLYMPGAIGQCTCHPVGLDDVEISAPGNFVAAPFEPESVTDTRAFLAAVEVDAAEGAATVVVLGDSITDGVGSTPKANHRWPDLLAERLAARGGRPWGVSNQGISGNRVLGDGAGLSALARLDSDALSVPGVKALILFEGVNDLGLSFGKLEGPFAEALRNQPGREITPEQMIAGYRQIIARAHARGIKVYGATIAPYKGSFYWSPEGEAARQEINEFIRTSGAFDAVLDFDKVFADPADPAAMRAGYHNGDHLHGSDAGYRAVADSIDLELFAR